VERRRWCDRLCEGRDGGVKGSPISLLSRLPCRIFVTAISLHTFLDGYCGTVQGLCTRVFVRHATCTPVDAYS